MLGHPLRSRGTTGVQRLSHPEPATGTWILGDRVGVGSGRGGVVQSTQMGTCQRVEFSCQSCGAHVSVEPLQRSTTCPFCDSPVVVDRPVTVDRPDPAFVIPFTVSRSQATQRVGRWLKGRRLAPFGLKKRAVDRAQGVYLPVYLYSAAAHSRFRASIAEEYKVVALKRGEAGISLGRDARKEYRDLQGSHATYVSDIVVTASAAVTNPEIEAIEPFDLTALARWSAGLVAGWLAEEPSLAHSACLDLARGEARPEVVGCVASFLPGDGHRNLEVQTSFLDETLDLTLVPVWVFALRYSDRRPPVRILVNGQSCAVHGKIPISWAKVSLIALGVLLLPLVVSAIVALVRWLS